MSLLKRFPKSSLKDEILFLPYAPQMLGSTEFFMRLFNLSLQSALLKDGGETSVLHLSVFASLKRSNSCMLILLTSRGDGD